MVGCLSGPQPMSKIILGLICHSVWSFGLYNPPNTLREPANFLSHGSDHAKFWALGPRTPVIGYVLAPQQFLKLVQHLTS